MIMITSAWGIILPRWLRAWAWRSRITEYKRGHWRYRKLLLAQLVTRLAFAVAVRYNRDPSRCWASLATWAMGNEDARLDRQVDTSCGWCGKCHPLIEERPV